jgi:uncharacterized Zn finger protein
MSNYPEYVPVAKKRENAEKQIAKMKKTQTNLAPIRITGKAIATTWWGKAWNSNLENYSDFSNRMPRGRSYVRNGMVIDLQIEKGVIQALVQGSERKPYRIEIKIASLSEEKRSEMVSLCNHKINNLAELLEGKFPKGLEELFSVPGKGLFPLIKDITFNCSCPDWASMCKHVAAALYGVGARLDQEPMLFFKLRDFNFEVLLKKSIEQKMDSMLKNAGKKSGRVLKDKDVFSLFGIASEVVVQESNQ